MPRRTHKKGQPSDGTQPVPNVPKIVLLLKADLYKFLELEAKRFSARYDRRILPTDVVKALITSYYEKRLAGLLVDPDD